MKTSEKIMQLMEQHQQLTVEQLADYIFPASYSSISSSLGMLVRHGKLTRQDKGVYALAKKEPKLPKCAYCEKRFTPITDPAFCSTKCLQAEMKRNREAKLERQEKAKHRQSGKEKCGECLPDVLAMLEHHPDILEFMGVGNPKGMYAMMTDIPGKNTVPIYKKSSFAN